MRAFSHSGNKKHGYMRGSTAGRTRPFWVNPWYCDGCKKEHGGRVFKTGLAGKIYCDRQYLKIKKEE